MTASYKARETWLADAMTELRTHFAACGWPIPENVRVSCGLPSGRAFSPNGRAIGEAWASTASKDQHFEIFVSPTIDDPTQVLATLAHELVHVAVGLKAGHRGLFIEAARGVGLAAPWTATSATDRLTAHLFPKIMKAQGAYPHGTLWKMTNGKKKQTSRLIKAGCTDCGYTIRASMMWLMLAVPTCPNEDCEKFGEAFDVDVPDADGEDA